MRVAFFVTEKPLNNIVTVSIQVFITCIVPKIRTKTNF